MVKIAILDDGNVGAIEKLLQNFLEFQICDDPSEYLDVLIVNEIYDERIPPAKIIIANSDDKRVLGCVSSMGGQIITYGLNPKAAITASSHTLDGFVVCVQRGMATIHNTPIFPHEFAVDVPDCGNSNERVMAAVSAALICGINFCE